MIKIPLTVNGAEKLRAELQQLKAIERPKVIAAIAEAPVESANTLINHYNSKMLIRYNLLLLLLHLLPRRVMRVVVDRQLYRYFPLVNPALLEIPLTFLMNDRKEIERARYLRRYLHFVPRILWQKFRLQLRAAGGGR